MDKIYRSGSLRTNNPRVISSLDERSDDWFSETLSRMSRHPALFVTLVLLCFLCLSISCDQIAMADSGVSESGAAIPEQATSGSLDVQTGIQSPAGALIDTSGESFFSRLFAGDAKEREEQGRWLHQVVTLTFRLTLAALLGAMVAFRPRRAAGLRQRNPYVMQSQILLTVVACALMMIVGDNTARAFGIFAAASLVRFRTKIRDPKEVTVLLINLGIGLAAGVGRYELATMFTLFVLLLLGILEGFESRQTFRNIKLSVKTFDVESTDEAVRGLFRRNYLDADIKEFNKEKENHPLGKVVYSVGVSRRLDTDQLVKEIYLADPVNVDRIEWHKKKTPS